ncbi:MAG: hypothetical protein CM15mP44_7980 [Candidatus Neomarinimicrobiota bacterium]|nr:MAG: hypothetical protein CM15mP44_7980 [Candidatus Neomarinimicrobiota bacterium]
MQKYYKDIGVALQAYLFRSLDDIDTLLTPILMQEYAKGFTKKIL